MGNAGARPDYDYPGEYIKAGVVLEKVKDGEYTYTYTMPNPVVSIPEELCQTLGNGVKYGFIGLQFEKPKGAASVKYTVGGGEEKTADLINPSPDSENVFEGNLLHYFGFALATGATAGDDKSWDVSLEWLDENGELIVKRSVKITRVTIDSSNPGGGTGGDGSGGDGSGGGNGGDNSEGGQPENPGTGSGNGEGGTGDGGNGGGTDNPGTDNPVNPEDIKDPTEE